MFVESNLDSFWDRIIDEILYCRFRFRIWVTNQTSNVLYETVWDKKTKDRRGHFSHLRALSLSVFILLLLSSTIITASKLHFQRIFATPICKTYPFGLPHNLVTIWRESGQGFGWTTTFLAVLGGDLKPPTLVMAQPCHLALSFFKSSINWE